MSDAPKHIWMSEIGACDFQDRLREDELRYTLTDGHEWDALMARIRDCGAVVDVSEDAHRFRLPMLSDYIRQTFAATLRDLLVYFGERP